MELDENSVHQNEEVGKRDLGENGFIFTAKGDQEVLEVVGSEDYQNKACFSCSWLRVDCCEGAQVYLPIQLAHAASWRVPC